MRADAARNSAKIQAIATTLFQERGLSVPIKEIAREAGVSHGTIYNLFGTREALINEVVSDLAKNGLGQLGTKALAHEDAWEGFVFYVEQSCAIQITEPAIGDVLSGKYPNAEALMTLCSDARDTAEQVLERAHASGQLRADFTSTDLALTFGAIAHLARTSHAVAPGAWQRTLRFMLDGLRTQAATSALTPCTYKDEDIYSAIASLSAPTQ